MNYFTLLGLPEIYPVEGSLLISQYRALQSQYHPDNFARKSDAERLEAVRMSALINDAYATLKDPLRCAEYFIELKSGNQLSSEVFHDNNFLMKQLALREEFDGIINNKKVPSEIESKLFDFANKLSKMEKEYYHQLNQAITDEQWTRAFEQTQRLHFVIKLIDQISEYEERSLDI